jgi:hypothetical protein
VCCLAMSYAAPVSFGRWFGRAAQSFFFLSTYTA